MKLRNPTHNANGGIDVEYNHPQFGWIPYSAHGDDVEPLGVEIYTAALTMSPAPYVAPEPEPVFANVEQARAAMVSWIEHFTESVTGPIPIDEKLSWDAKEVAARSYMNDPNTVASADMAMLVGEAGVVGEKVDDLVSRIVSNANRYRFIVAAVAGLRRKTNVALNAVVNPHDYELVLNAAKGEAAAMAKSMGL